MSADNATKNASDRRPQPGLEATLVAAALAGGRAVLAVYRSDFTVARKADDTPVCAADNESEAAVLAALADSFPDVPVVAEEAAAAGRAGEPSRRFFLVDPLDGTKEFIGRNGEFTVNIALVEDGVPVAGVVLAPALGKMFVAVGGRAWLARTDADCQTVSFERQLKVRDAPAEPVAVASRSHGNEATEAMLERAAIKDRRSVGSSLKFCLVAEAQADIYPRLGTTMEWDTAAGDAVLRSAGGRVVDLDGAPLAYGKAGAPGVRPFQNPHFLAAGDDRMLERVGAKRAA